MVVGLMLLSFFALILTFVALINPRWFKIKGKQYPRKAYLKLAGITFVLFIVFAAIEGKMSENKGLTAATPVVSTSKEEANKSPNPEPSKPSDPPKPADKPLSPPVTAPTAKVVAPASPTSNTTETKDAAKKRDDFSPEFKPEATAIASNGGLGDSFGQIEKVLGKATRINQPMKEGIGQYNYQDDLEVVMYIQGRVQSIAYQLTDSKKKTMSEKDALEFVKQVMPADATLIKKYDKDNMERIYVYHSKSLEGLFSDDWFKDGDGKIHQGEFGISFAHDENSVGSFTASIGVE